MPIDNYTPDEQLDVYFCDPEFLPTASSLARYRPRSNAMPRCRRFYTYQHMRLFLMAAQNQQENCRETCSTEGNMEDEEVRVADKWTKVHGANSRIHRLIKNLTLPRGQNLLEKELEGDKNCLCLGPGRNCFVVALASRCTNNNLQSLLNIEPEGVNCRDQNGLSLLMLSLHEVRFVKLLLENGADPNAEDLKGNTVLMRVFLQKAPSNFCTYYEDVIDYLIDGGANLFFPPSNLRSENNIFTFALKLLLENETTIFSALNDPSDKTTSKVFSATGSLFQRKQAESCGLPPDVVKELRHCLRTRAENKKRLFALTLKLQSLYPEMQPPSLHKFQFKTIASPAWRRFDETLILQIALDCNHYCLINELGRAICEYYSSLMRSRVHEWHNYFCLNGWVAGGTLSWLQGHEFPLDVLDPSEEDVLSPGIVLMNEFLKLKADIASRRILIANNRGPAEPMEHLGFLHLIKGKNFPTYLSGKPGTFWHDSYIKLVPVELLMIHMSMYLQSRNEDEELYKAMLPYTPVHPFALYKIDWAFETSFLKLSQQGINFVALKNDSLPVLQKVVNFVLEYCGSHFGGIVNNPSSCLFTIDVPQYMKPASLKDMSRWALRMAIAEQRVTKSLSLPAYIKKLVEQRYLPKPLENYMLVFPPSKYFPY